MNISTRWNNFWFSDAPYFDLALMRIVCVAFQLFYLLDSQYAQLGYVLSLPVDLYHPPILMRIFTGAETPLGADFIYAVFWVTLIAGFGGLFGLLTNASLCVFALGNLILQLFAFSFSDFHHPEAIMIIGLMPLALSPSGRVFSLDNLVARFRGKSNLSTTTLLDYSGPYAGWPIRFIQCFFPLMYISAAVAKIAYADYSLDWANGFTLQYYFIQDDIRKVSPLAVWASQFHWTIWFGQIAVLFYQITYFAVVPYPRLRWIYLPIGLGFHLANYLIIKAPFPQWIIFLLLAYIPWSQTFKMLSQARVSLPKEARETRTAVNVEAGASSG